MSAKQLFIRFLDNFESYACRVLLVGFVVLLFVQIIAREIFGFSFSWIEELSVYMFVWFAYFGASHAAKLAAHNRVTFQFKAFSPKVAVFFESIADVIWVAFNLYFVYLSWEFISHMNKFVKSQTLGVHMKWFYMVLPIAFIFMTIRVIQVNYLRLVKGVDIRDPDASELDGLKETMSGEVGSKEPSRN